MGMEGLSVYGGLLLENGLLSFCLWSAHKEECEHLLRTHYVHSNISACSYLLCP